jgi:hypothetical protein
MAVFEGLADNLPECFSGLCNLIFGKLSAFGIKGDLTFSP